MTDQRLISENLGEEGPGSVSPFQTFTPSYNRKTASRSVNFSFLEMFRWRLNLFLETVSHIEDIYSKISKVLSNM